MKKSLERKAFEFKLDSPPDDQGRFSGYAATFGNEDLGHDIIEAGAFSKTLRENPKVPILWSHDTDQPIGVSTSMVEDGKGLRVEAQLDMNVQRAREVHSLMKLGAVKGLSIGYGVVKRYFTDGVRHLQELKLAEFSPCVFPMNPQAGVDGIKDVWLGGDGLQGVASLLSAIEACSNFLDNETREGDAEDAAIAQSILSDLVVLLASELADVGQPEEDDAPAPVPMSGTMRQSVEASVQTLTDVLDGKVMGRRRKAETTNISESDFDPFYELLSAMRGGSR